LSSKIAKLRHFKPLSEGELAWKTLLEKIQAAIERRYYLIAFLEKITTQMTLGSFPELRQPSRLSLWTALLAQVRDRIPETAYNTWFTHLHLAEVSVDGWLVGVPNAFMLEYVEHHYRAVLEDAAGMVTGTAISVSFTLAAKPEDEDFVFHPATTAAADEAAARQPGSPTGADKSSTPGAPATVIDSSIPLVSRYTFEDFVIGDCNQLAHAACMAVAEAPGRNKFNPLVLHGGAGMGKTHLLQAIAHFCRENETARKIVYRTSEEFTREYISFVQKNKDSRAFYKSYQDADILLIDDIQFLAGKPGTQDEFFNIFSALQSFNRQIVITSDRPPAQIDGLNTRLISRFDTGLLADLQPPGLETRLAILRKKAESDAESCIDAGVLDFVARQVTSNVRELEGTLIKLSAYACFSGTPLTVEIARQILGDTVRNRGRRVTLKGIIEATASEFGIPAAQLTSQTRRKNVAEPRHAAMYLARQLTDNSLHTIGLSFGRDYSTVIHSLKRAEQMIESDAAFAERLEGLRLRLV
jgi:chromosomal replication initiator protein